MLNEYWPLVFGLLDFGGRKGQRNVTHEVSTSTYSAVFFELVTGLSAIGKVSVF